jgi:EAL domain-containing protein (putative c-di-GMP-specific phosphodiesterase class I)
MVIEVADHRPTRTPRTLIKLDRALTTGIDFDPVRRALAKALHSFSSDTGASIIAEGIETAVTLQEIGIPYGQGYYLGRPGPVERLKPTFVPLDKSPSVGSFVNGQRLHQRHPSKDLR